MKDNGEKWEFESNPGWQTAVAWACVAVGVALLYFGRGFAASGSTNVVAGFLLGVLLLIIGIGAIWTVAKQTVVIDCGARRITVIDTSARGDRTRVIPFGEIARTGIGFLGRRSTFMFYYIVLHLKDGKEYSLFAPGRFYAGGFDREVMEGRRLRLEGALRAQGRDR